MFDRTHALARRQHHVARGDVVLEVDEGLRLRRVAMRRRKAEIAAMRGRRGLDARAAAGVGAPAAAAPAAAPSASASASANTPRHAPRRALVLRRHIGHESLRRFVEGELAARLREEMNARRPAAAHRDEIAGDRLAGPGRSVRPALGDQRMRDAQMAARADDRRVRLDAQARLARRLRQVALGLARADRRSAAISTPASARSSAAR